MATLSQIEEEDNEIYAYVVLGAICIGFLLLLAQLYYANYDLVQRLHIDIPFLDKHVFSKEGMTLLLGDSYKVRNVVLFLFAFSLTSPSKGEKRRLSGGSSPDWAFLLQYFIAVVFSYLSPLPQSDSH